MIKGNYDRYALINGPILMALQGDLNGPGGVPQLTIAPDDLKDLLIPVEGNPLEYNIREYPGYRYMPYWKINTESFTCFPVVQP